ncbi:hypothetical protein LAZ67_X000408 [Cordylochernes scorpioides]|uniref:RNA-directed DNA polymerase n=1 Tax=Cordylochernes scorpioides TaxID=51811 RepID=A0ABY6LRK0_9ARAC|nr:hypothetical protein LAZ67_X000408 [Cordylochernes scorpioides]
MPRRKIRAHYEHMSEFETSRAIGLKEAGWSNRLIARHLCRSDAAIRRCWQKWVNNGRMQRQDGSGRSRAKAELEDRAIVRMAVAAPESTLSTIQRVIGTQVPKMAINRRLRERNLRARRPLRYLPLTPVHQQVRLQRCRERSTWNCADWGRIVVSDESRFLLYPDDRRKRVWRRPGQRLDPGLIVEHHTVPQQGVMMTFYGLFCCRSSHITPGLLFNKIMPGHTRHVLLWIVFNLAEFFRGQQGRLISRDSEHIWDVMGRRLQPSRNVDYLVRQLETIWQEIPQHTIRNLYQSMTRRVAACIQATDSSSRQIVSKWPAGRNVVAAISLSDASDSPLSRLCVLYHSPPSRLRNHHLSPRLNTTNQITELPQIRKKVDRMNKDEKEAREQEIGELPNNDHRPTTPPPHLGTIILQLATILERLQPLHPQDLDLTSFDEKTDTTYAKFFDTKSQHYNSLEEYFRTKATIGIQLNLPRPVIIEALTEGLPTGDQRLVRIVTPKSLSEWYELTSRVRGNSPHNHHVAQTTFHGWKDPTTISHDHHHGHKTTQQCHLRPASSAKDNTGTPSASDDLLLKPSTAIPTTPATLAKAPSTKPTMAARRPFLLRQSPRRQATLAPNRWSLRLSAYDYEIRYVKDADTIKIHQNNTPTHPHITQDTNGLHTITRKGVTKILIPEKLRSTLLNKGHLEYNHPGISQMSRLISGQYNWSGMSRDIKNHVNSCTTCQLTKHPKGPTYGELGQTPSATKPFDLLSIDTVSGFAKYGNSKTHLHNFSNHINPYPPIDIARQQAYQRTQLKHDKDKQKFDLNHKTPNLEIGDLVLVKVYHHPNTGKLTPYFTGPYTILEIISRNVVKINRPNHPLNMEHDTIHVNKLRAYTEGVPHIAPPTMQAHYVQPKDNDLFPFRHLSPDLFQEYQLRSNHPAANLFYL